MPNIPTYDQPSLGLQPTEIGAESFAAAGRRGGAFFNQAGESIANAGARAGRALATVGDVAVNYMDHQQINAGAEHGANLFANLTDSWNQTAAGSDPHDPSVAKKFREEVLEPALTQFQDGFSTEKSQEWAAHFTNTMRQHFFEKTETDMSSMAAAAVNSTVQTLGTKFSNTAFSDATAVPAMLDAVDHSIDGILGANPNIKGPQAVRVREETAFNIKKQIIAAGAEGVIAHSPNPIAAADAWAKRYPDYISGAEAEKLARAANTQNKANAMYDKQTQLAQKQLDTFNVDKERTKIMSDNLSVDEKTGQVTLNPQYFKDTLNIGRKFPNAPNAGPTIETMLKMGHAIQTQETAAVSNPAVYSSLTDKATDPNTSFSDLKIAIDKAVADKQLSIQDRSRLIPYVNALESEPIKEPAFKYATEAAKEQIEGAFGVKIPQQAGKYPAFMQAFTTEYLKQKRAGTLPANALNMDDPKSLIRQTLDGGHYLPTIGGTIRANGGVGAAEQSPVPDARKAPDGNWYVERPPGSGKFFHVGG